MIRKDCLKLSKKICYNNGKIKKKVNSSVKKYLNKTKNKNTNMERFIRVFLHMLLVYAKPMDKYKMTPKLFLNEILNGAYCIIKGDKGEFFDFVINHYKNSTNIKFKRNVDYGIGGHSLFSSHFSDNDHWRVGKGTIYGLKKNNVNRNFDLLIGKRPIISKWNKKYGDYKEYFKDHQGDTWFQFEESRNNTYTDRLRHSLSSSKYLLSVVGEKTGLGKRKNIGPFGKSVYTEFNFLVLEINK